ncbi:MAG TPA: RIO1 family regulatory kinase/ATPase [Candidatus Nanoarchaeia archaeon]|nr:RIO1 family regulatory kinase/ATPase [Candidatus Nanoarchaeia archaeon]
MSKITREKFKTQDDVFDRFTQDNIRKLIGQNHFEEDSFSPLFIGKESNVFKADSHRGPVIVKIYRLQTCDFNKMYSYIKNDPRYTKLRKQRRNVVFAWCQREYRNLFTAREAGVRVPLPFAFSNNILVMEFIGDESVALKVKNDYPKNPKEFLDECLENVKKLVKGGLVHGDLSSFNILNWNQKPIFIDFSQSMPVRAMGADQLLARDLKNLLDFFAKNGEKRDFDKIYASLLKEFRKKQ